MRIVKLLVLTFASSVAALPVVALPWFGHLPLDGIAGYLGYISDVAEDRTIYQVLKDDEQYSCLVKAIDFSESVADLNDPSKSITFFAVPNSKLRRHHGPHHGHGGHGFDQSLLPYLEDSLSDFNYNFGDLIQHAEEFEKEPESLDEKKRKEALARIIHKIISYHILPESYGTADLVQNSTYATNFIPDDGSMDSEPLRLSILNTLLPPRLTINMFAEVTKRDIKAKNGVIHRVSHPLLPPPSIFQETFFAPKVFSFFTSAIQRVGLRGAIDCSWGDKYNVDFSGTTATTVFAPTSGAFERLPAKLRGYLFSPFGQKALKKLLKYHIVPNFVLYTDYSHNSTSYFSPCFDDELETRFAVLVPALLDEEMENLVLSGNNRHSLEVVYEYSATLPTLLPDHHLRIHTARYKIKLPLPGFPQYFTSFRVNGHDVKPFDIPAHNGALHVLSTILDPRKGCGAHDADIGDNDETAWEDWEEWLPQWAMEN